jgi:ribosomal protein S12 methylthiotransferase
MKSIYLESLGCARNQVDSEIMLGRLEAAGWHITDDPEIADAIVVNTCSFIESAADESIDTILALAAYKQSGQCRQLIVTGCLPQRYRDDIRQALPEVDLFLGTGGFADIVDALAHPHIGRACRLPAPGSAPAQRATTPRRLLDSHMAYIRISEGCNRHCTYCIIPSLRGRQQSRQPRDIVQECASLQQAGIKEAILVAEDTTAYGQDLTPPLGLNDLLRQLTDAINLPPAPSLDDAGASADFRLRLLYGHPSSIDSRVIATVAAHPRICPYFDLPIQHASPKMLERMGRHYRPQRLLDLIADIRRQAPGATVRTTVIVGFPGEDDDDFQQLLDFIQVARFDLLGAFVYSDAADLPSHHLDGHVRPEIAQNRFDQVMALQESVSADLNQRHLDRIYHVLIDGRQDDGLLIGRTAHQAPDVDGLTLIARGHAEIGSYARVKITDTLAYDLIGEIIS